MRDVWGKQYGAEETEEGPVTTAEPESPLERDGAMDVDEESVLAASKRGKGKEVPRKERVAKASAPADAVPVASAASTPVRLGSSYACYACLTLKSPISAVFRSTFRRVTDARPQRRRAWDRRARRVWSVVGST